MIETYINELGLWIAYAGVLVVVIGVFLTLARLLHYWFTGMNEEHALALRHSLMIYLSLGLDFIIAKDVIVTLSLEQSDYQGIIQLVAVIGIRILLSYFVHLEEKVLHFSQMKQQEDSKEQKKRRTSRRKVA